MQRSSSCLCSVQGLRLWILTIWTWILVAARKVESSDSSSSDSSDDSDLDEVIKEAKKVNSQLKKLSSTAKAVKNGSVMEPVEDENIFCIVLMEENLRNHFCGAPRSRLINSYMGSISLIMTRGLLNSTRMASNSMSMFVAIISLVALLLHIWRLWWRTMSWISS